MKHIGRNRMTSINEAKDLIRMINDSLDTNSGITWAMAFIDEPQTLMVPSGFGG